MELVDERRALGQGSWIETPTPSAVCSGSLSRLLLLAEPRASPNRHESSACLSGWGSPSLTPGGNDRYPQDQVGVPPHLRVLLSGIWIVSSLRPCLKFAETPPPHPLTSPPGPSASQGRPGPRTSTAWSTPTTSAWNWRRSSTIAVTSPSGGSQSSLPTWGSLSGRCVGPTPTPASPITTGAVLGVWPPGCQADYRLQEEKREVEFPDHGHTAQQKLRCCQILPLETKPNIPNPSRGMGHLISYKLQLLR